MDFVNYFINEIEQQGLWKAPVTIKRNDFLKQGNTIDTNLYFVVRGSFRVFVIDENEEHTIRFGYKNNLIAALDSFITESNSDLYIQALKESTVKAISKKDFLNFINSSEEYMKTWVTMLGMLVNQQMERERDLLTTSPVERYKRVLKRSPQLFQEIPNRYIASYLRMTPETLSRIKKS